MFAILRQRNFVLLFGESLISSTGDWVLYAAVPYYVYARTGSAFASALTFVIEITPSILLGTVGGVLADRWDRKRAIVAGEVLMGLVLLPILAAPAGALLPLLYAGVLGVAMVAQVTGPASSAALPLVVGEEQLVAANSAFSAANNIARILGSALGGVLMAGIGLRAVVGVDALSFLLAAGCVAVINVPLQAERRALGEERMGAWRRTWREWIEGLRVVIHRRWIAAIFLVVGIAVLGDGMFTVLIAPFVRHTLHASALVFGWVLTARGIGGLIGTFIVPLVGKRMSARALIGWSAIADGVVVTAMALLASVPTLLVLTLAIGTPVVGFYVSVPTLLQQGVEDEVRGRIFGAYGTVAQLMVLLGMLVAGTAVARTGIILWVYMSGSLYILAGLVGLALLRRAPKVEEDGVDDAPEDVVFLQANQER